VQLVLPVLRRPFCAISLHGCYSLRVPVSACSRLLFLQQAKKFLAERSPAYMTARTALREMRSLTDTLFRPLLPKVPTWCASPADGPRPAYSSELSHREQAHVEGWKNYLVWEESNPLQLEDLPTLHGRVLMAYRKATMHMRFYPELW
jgi:cleavage stimulation factor subunit 3